MVYSQKYCLVQLLSPLAVGSEFTSTDWPLHCTIAGVFALDWTEEVLREFENMLTAQQRSVSCTTSIAFFGPEKNVKVRLVAMTPELYALHEQVVGFIEHRGGSFNEPHYQREHFVPHITMQAGLPAEGAIIQFYELALIDMFPNGDHTRRRIAALWPLKGFPSSPEA